MESENEGEKNLCSLRMNVELQTFFSLIFIRLHKGEVTQLYMKC